MKIMKFDKIVKEIATKEHRTMISKPQFKTGLSRGKTSKGFTL
jgi:hypothetical protein